MRCRPWLEKFSSHHSLLEISVESTLLFFELLEIKPRLFFSSNLPERGIKSERLISLCQAVKADIYYSGLASTRYLDLSRFRANNLQVLWQHWKQSLAA